MTPAKIPCGTREYSLAHEICYFSIARNRRVPDRSWVFFTYFEKKTETRGLGVVAFFLWIL